MQSTTSSSGHLPAGSSPAWTFGGSRRVPRGREGRWRAAQSAEGFTDGDSGIAKRLAARLSHSAIPPRCRGAPTRDLPKAETIDVGGAPAAWLTMLAPRAFSTTPRVLRVRLLVLFAVTIAAVVGG